MQHDGTRSYSAPPVHARVMEQRIREPTAVADSTTKYLSFLRDEWRAATTKTRREAIEVEALEVKRQAHASDDYAAALDRDMTPVFGRPEQRDS